MEPCTVGHKGPLFHTNAHAYIIQCVIVRYNWTSSQDEEKVKITWCQINSWKRGRDRARSSERRRLGKAFQKDGPTTATLLRWAVASLTLGTPRSPCSAERRDLRPGKDDTGTQSSLR